MSRKPGARGGRRCVSRGPQGTDPRAGCRGYQIRCRARVPRPRRQSRRSQNYSRGLIRGRSPVFSNPGLDGFVPSDTRAAEALPDHARNVYRDFVPWKSKRTNAGMVERMARGYLEIYRELAAASTKPARARKVKGKYKSLHSVDGVAVKLLPAVATPLQKEFKRPAAQP
jgi:hypothetical protein